MVKLDLRGVVCAVAAVTAVAACGSTTTTPSPSETTTPSSATSTPPSSTQSGFCLDRPLYTVVLVAFSAGVGKAGLRGKNSEADRAELVRLAGVVARVGGEMLPSAPADVKDALATTIDAVAESSSHINPNEEILQAVEPMYREKTETARKALDDYDCG